MNMNDVGVSSFSSPELLRKRHSLTSTVTQPSAEQEISEEDVCSLEGSVIERLQQNTSWIRSAVFLRWLLADEGMTAIVPAFLWILGGTEGMLLMVSLTLNELLNGCIKWICQRPRPFWTNSKIKNLCSVWEEDFGFPSSHAQISTCFFTCILIQYGLLDRLRESVSVGSLLLFVFLLWIVLGTGIARVYLGVHYPSDVIVGWLIGLGVPIAFQSLDLLTCFRNLSPSYRLWFCVSVPFVLYSCFATIRFVVRQPECVGAWEETAHRNEVVPSSRTIQTFLLSKYTIQIWSLTGGLLGISMAMADGRLRFVLEECHWDEIVPYSLSRTVLGYTVLLFLLFPLTFLLPKIVRGRSVMSFVFKCTGAFLMGWWALYGCPKLADMAFNGSCPLHPPLLASPYLQMDVDQLKTECHLEGSTPLVDSHPPNLFRPTSIEELQAFVRKQDPQRTVLRVFGSSQSTSSSRKIVDIQLSAPAFTRYEILSTGEENGERQGILIEAGAGLYLGENEYRSISGAESLLSKMAEDHLSFANVPTPVDQTLGNILSTGSEGRSFDSFFQEVVGLRLVDGRGNLHTLWRNATENIQFRGALQSMGLMGIVVSVIITPTQQFCVRHSYHPTIVDNEQIDTFINEIEETFGQNDYSGYFLFPPAEGSLSTGAHRSPRVLVAHRFRMNRTSAVSFPSCVDPSKRGSSSFLASAGQLSASLLSNILLQPACLKNKTVFFDLLARSDVYARLTELARLDQGVQVALERCLAELNKVSFDRLQTHGVSFDLYLACSMAQWTPPYSLVESVRQPTVGPSHLVLPSNQIGDLHQISFPLSNRSSFKRVLEVYLTEIITQPQDDRRVFTEIYVCPGSDALLSPTRGLPSLCLNIIPMKRSPHSSVQVYRHFWQLFERHGLSFTVQWGKTFPIAGEDRTLWCDIRAQYQENGAWATFETLLEKFDPVGVFRDVDWMADC